MIKKLLLIVCVLSGLITGTAAAQDGQAIFEKHCSACHAPGMNYPGTHQLTKTRGEENGVLEERDNLVPVYVKTIARNGLNAMPAFKPTQITDQQLEVLAAYLSE